MAVRILSPKLEEVARQELNEDPKRREEDLKHIRDWLVKQPHLIARTDSQWLTTFLRGCKFSLERTKEKLDMFYSLRTALPEFFTNRDPMLHIMQQILKLGVITPLKDTDDKGRRVILLRVGIYDPAEVNVLDVFKLSFMIIDILLEEDDQMIVNGEITIIDLSHVTLSHAAQLLPSVVKKAMTASQVTKILQNVLQDSTFYFNTVFNSLENLENHLNLGNNSHPEGYPLRHQGIHYIHTPSGFETVFNLFKSFMKEKLKKRLYVHGDNVEALHKHLPKRILPQEYGGGAGPIAELAEEWKKKVEARRPWFLEDEKYRSDEKKRPGGRPKTQEDLFGLDGSFRQLSVD